MLVKSLLGKINDPENAPFSTYAILDDNGNIIYGYSSAFNIRIIYCLDRGSLKYKQIDFDFFIYKFPVCIEINNDSVILILDEEVHHLDLLTQSVTKCKIILSDNDLLYYGTQIYEQSKHGIKVIEFVNYPDIDEFIIPADIDLLRIIKYSTTKILQVTDFNQRIYSYHLPIFNGDPQLIEVSKKQSIYIKSKDTKLDQIASFHHRLSQRIQYRQTANYKYINQMRFTDEFLLYVHSDQQYECSIILQLRPKNKIIRKILRKSLMYTQWEQTIIKQKFILGIFDLNYQLYNVMNGKKTVQYEAGEYQMYSKQLIERGAMDINVYQLSVTEQNQ